MEYVQSNEKVWFKMVLVTPLPSEESHAQFILSYNGTERRTLELTADGTPTFGSVGGDLATEGVGVNESPTVTIGLRFGALGARSPLYADLRENKFQLQGIVKIDGRDVIHFSGNPLGEAEIAAGSLFHLYLDPQHQFLPIRQEYSWRGNLQIREKIDEFAQFVDPHTKQSRWFPSKVTKEYFGSKLLETTDRVTTRSLEINPAIPDSLFESTMPGEIMVVDSRTHKTTFNGDEKQRREFLLKRAAETKTAQIQRRVPLYSRVPWWPIGVGIALAGSIAVRLMLRRRMHGKHL